MSQRSLHFYPDMTAPFFLASKREPLKKIRTRNRSLTNLPGYPSDVKLNAAQSVDNVRVGIEEVGARRRRCEKSTIPVIPSEARNLPLFVFKRINADASLRSA